MRPEHLDLLRTPSTPAVHPDGWAVVAVTRTDVPEDTYPAQLWRIPLAGGGARQVTFGARDSEPVVSPDGRWIAFVRAAKGKRPQVAVMPSDGGEPVVLTDHSGGVSGGLVFAPDSASIAYTARVPEQGRYGTQEGVGPDAEPPRHITRFTYRIDGAGFYADRPQHVFTIALPELTDPTAVWPVRAAEDDGAGKDDGATGDDGAGQVSDATGGDGGSGADGDSQDPSRAGVGVSPVQVSGGDRDHRNPEWTPDGQSLIVIRAVPDALAGQVVLLRADGSDGGAQGSGGTVLDGPRHGAAMVRTGPGDAIWLLSSDLGDDGFDFIGKTPVLYSARLNGTDLTDLQAVSDPMTGSLSGAVFLVDGQDVLLTRARRGSTELVRYRGGQVEEVFAGEVSVSGAALAPDGQVVLSAATTRSPGEVFVVGQEVRRLTDLASVLHGSTEVFEPVELQVESEDGYPVHGWVSLPAGEGPHPVLLLIHGGPHAQYESVFFDEVQVYTEAGYAVVFCNPRGSAGYGQEHGRAITGAFGDRDAADVLAFFDGALAAHPSLDGDRAGVLGGSYGGYMTAWLTTRTDRFTAAIVERGFLDPVSFEGSSDIGWFFGIQYLGEDAQQVAAQSPMAHIDRVSTPTLVIHSENDWRCPVEQGQRWFVGLKRRGVSTEFLLFPGEGHELSRSGRPKHRVARFEHILRWWQTYLPVESSTSSS